MILLRRLFGRRCAAAAPPPTLTPPEPIAPIPDGRTVVRDLGGGWTLRRWQYEGAPLELHGPRLHLVVVSRASIEIAVDARPGLTIYSEVPVAGLLELMRDAR